MAVRSQERPEIAVLVSTYQRPWHLRRALESLRCQSVDPTTMEVVVTDDGSQDETQEVVEQFVRHAPFPVTFTTHPHTAFHLSRCRNEGVAASTAPYLLFLDGDCIVNSEHVREHLRRRRPRTVMAGYCYLLDRVVSPRVTLETIQRGEFDRWVSAVQRRRVRKLDWKARWYTLIGHATKPKLFGGNIGMWRCDYERVNGYDEDFQGWGCEDDDLRLRLRRAGIAVRSILRWTQTYHLWHPPAASTPRNWRDGRNVQRLQQHLNRHWRCERGLDQCQWPLAGPQRAA